MRTEEQIFNHESLTWLRKQHIELHYCFSMVSIWLKTSTICFRLILLLYGHISTVTCYSTLQISRDLLRSKSYFLKNGHAAPKPHFQWSTSTPINLNNVHAVCPMRRLVYKRSYKSMVQLAALLCMYGAMACMVEKKEGPAAAAAIQCQSTSTLTAVQRVRRCVTRVSREKAIILSTHELQRLSFPRQKHVAALPAIAAAAAAGGQPAAPRLDKQKVMVGAATLRPSISSPPRRR